MCATLRLGVVLLLLAYCLPQAVAVPLIVTSDINTTGSDLQETGFGDFAADSLRSRSGADIAFLPASAIRPAIIPAAGLDTDALSSLLVVTDSPSDSVVTVKLTGVDIEAALERSVSRLPAAFGGFLQVSGLKVLYNSSKNEGHRILSVELTGGAPLSPTSVYTVAMTKPLADGALGYFEIWNSVTSVKPSGSSFTATLSTYAAAHQPLDIHTDGRLTSQ